MDSSIKQPKRTWVQQIRKVRLFGDIAIVPLNTGKVAVIDAVDVELVDGWNWTEHKGYAARGASVGGGRARTLWLHYAIMGTPPPGMMWDHRDGDGLFCRRHNLRAATAQQNTWNRKLSSANRSGFKGVCFRSDRGTWLAQITINGRQIKIGTFKNWDDAARAYDKKATEFFGEFASLNFPKFDAAEPGAAA